MVHSTKFVFLVYVLYLFTRSFCSKNENGISPKKYTLSIEPYISNFTFRGIISIDFSIANATKQLLLNAKQLKHTEIRLKSLKTTKPTEINVGFMNNNNGSWLLFTIEELIGEYSLNISFRGHISSIKEEEGLFYNTYIDKEKDKVYLATETRTWESCSLFPSFNCPLTKTPFTARIARDPLHVTLSNLELKKTSLEQDKVWDTFYAANLYTHQVGFIIHDLSNVSTDNFTVLTKSEAMDQTNHSLTLLPTLAQTVLNQFPNHSTTKLKVVALPDGGPSITSYPGLVFCREDQILFKKKVSNTKSLQQVKESLVRILVRQLLLKVPTEERELTEALATYVEQNILNQLEPTRKTTESLYMDLLKADSTGIDKDSTHKFQQVAGILKMVFDDFSLQEVVMKAVSQTLNVSIPVTAEQFFSTIDQLVGTLNDLPSNYSYSAILQAWKSQTGWPVVMVAVNGSTVTVSQMSSTKNNATWPIPLNFKGDIEFVENVNHSHTLWLTKPSVEESLASILNKWVIFGAPNGLYRVNYDSSGWNTLIDQLMVNHSVIPSDTRSRLVDDIFYMAERRLVDYEQLFRLTRYLVNETDYLPWKTAASNFEKLINLFHGTQLGLDIQEYAKSLYSPYFEKVYRITSLNETRVDLLASSEALFWGCHWELPSCLQFTSELFKQWQSASTRFPPDYKPSALCTGVRETSKVFMEVFDSFTQSVVEGDRMVFLRALACTENPIHIGFLLNHILLEGNQTTIPHHSKLPLIQHLVEYPEKIFHVISFLEKNYDKAVKTIGSKTMTSIWAAIETNVYATKDILLIQNMASNVSLPVSLRESLSSVLAAAASTQRKAAKLSPLVTKGLSQYWAITSSGAQSQSQLHFCDSLVLVLAITLVIHVFKF